MVASAEEQRQAAETEEFMRKQKELFDKDVKVLLLGAGESGKSTIVKQIKAVHAGKISEEERRSFAKNMHENTIQVLHMVLDAAETLKLTWPAEFATMVTQLRELDESVRLDEPTAANIQQLWNSEFVQAMWNRRNEFYILDAAPYYFNNADRFAEDDFIPTEEDAVMARVRTTGIVVSEFDQEGIHYRIVDVGGQRNERRKWMHCFDDVKAIIFCASLIGYNQVLFEDSSVNRMTEAINLFSDIVNKDMFKDVPIFLFFNKKDLFEGEIKSAPLQTKFPEYTGDNSFDDAVEFIVKQFKAAVQDGRNIKHEVVAARVRKDMKYAWLNVKEELEKLRNQKKK